MYYQRTNNGSSTRGPDLPKRRSDPGPIIRAGVVSLAGPAAGDRRYHPGGSPVQWAQPMGVLAKTPGAPLPILAAAKRPRHWDEWIAVRVGRCASSPTKARVHNRSARIETGAE
jgi:hypothetical protein